MLLVSNPCGAGMTPRTVDVNGTIFLTCIERPPQQIDTQTLIIVLCTVIPGCIAFVVVCMCWVNELCPCSSSYKRRQLQLISPATRLEIANKFKRWEAFIHDGSYIRRIAQVLESESVVPYEIDDYLRSGKHEIEYVKLCNQEPHVPCQEKAARIIHMLFRDQSEHENRPILDVIAVWKKKLIETCGGELSYAIMARVEELVLASHDVPVAPKEAVVRKYDVALARQMFIKDNNIYRDWNEKDVRDFLDWWDNAKIHDEYFEQKKAARTREMCNSVWIHYSIYDDVRSRTWIQETKSQCPWENMQIVSRD